MANEWDENKPEEETAAPGPSAEGMVEAVTQDVELIVDKVMDAAGDAVVVVQETLGLREPARPRARKPAKKPKGARSNARATKTKARAAKAKPSKAAKTKARKLTKKAAKPGRAAKLKRPTKPKRRAKSPRASKSRKSGRKR